MITAATLRPLRVEQILRLLPDIDAMAPLRASVVSTSQVGTAVEPYLTVGKRFVEATDLRELVPMAVARFTKHLVELYDAAVEALEAMERSNLAGAARALLRAGKREEGVGRDTAARAWYEIALQVSEELRDRRPEFEALRRLASLEAAHGSLEESARLYQRSLVLAEAELDNESAALACQGLAQVALARGADKGPEAWFTRGLQFARDHPRLSALLTIGLAEVACQRGDQAAAETALRAASETALEMADSEGQARLHNAWGLLDVERGQHADGLLHYQEALALTRSGDRNLRLEMEIRRNVCNLYLDWGRLPDAEDEIRRAEEMAISHNLTRDLAHIYILIGKVRGRQGDETGFIFFEKAVELCRGREPSPRIEAEAYVEYGRFKEELGEREEAPAYFERAREILSSLGDGSSLARVNEQLARVQSA